MFTNFSQSVLLCSFGTQKTSRISFPAMTIPIITLLYFHWGQSINYLMGLQIFWVLGSVGMITFIYGVLKKNFKLSLVAHLISILSFPIWPIQFSIAIIVFFHEFMDLGRWNELKFWLKVLGTFICTGIYFCWIYVAGHTEAQNFDLLNFLRFFIFSLASPFSRYNETLAWVFGPLFLALTVCGMTVRSTISKSTAYLALLSFSLISAALIAYGRHGFDRSYAFSGHYMVLTIPGWCVLLLDIIERLKSYRLGKSLIWLISIYIVFLSARGLYVESRKRYPRLVNAKACIESGDFDSERCRQYMEYVFLNGYETKIRELRHAKSIGVIE